MARIRAKVEEINLLGGEPVAAPDVPAPLPASIESYGDLRWLVGTYYALQDHRVQASNRLLGLKRSPGIGVEFQARATNWLHQRLERQEAEIKSAVQKQIGAHPLWSGWLKGVHGVGPCIAGSLIAYVEGEHYTALRTPEEIARARGSGWEVVEREILVKARSREQEDQSVKGSYRVRRGPEAFDTVSKFWSYCGLGLDGNGLVQRPRAGQRSTWNPHLKQVAWKAAASFVRCGDGYRRLYEEIKSGILAQPSEIVSLAGELEPHYGKLLVEHEGKPMLTKVRVEALRRRGVLEARLALRPAHAEARARRKLAKIFMAHVLMRWRSLLCLSTPAVYAVDRLGHKTEIPVIES